MLANICSRVLVFNLDIYFTQQVIVRSARKFNIISYPVEF